MAKEIRTIASANPDAHTCVQEEDFSKIVKAYSYTPPHRRGCPHYQKTASYLVPSSKMELCLQGKKFFYTFPQDEVALTV